MQVLQRRSCFAAFLGPRHAYRCAGHLRTVVQSFYIAQTLIGVMQRPDEQGQPSSEEQEAFIGQEGVDGFEGQVLDDLEGEGVTNVHAVPAAVLHAPLQGAKSVNT